MGKNNLNFREEFKGPPSSASEGALESVRSGILRRAASTARQQLQFLAWRFGWRRPLAYAVLSEIYRIVPRIRFVLTALQVDQGRELSAGPACWHDRGECHQECNRTHARIHGIREQETVIPWMGTFEAYLFFRGWNAAERYLAGSSCTDSGTENISPQSSPVLTNSQEGPAQSNCDL